MSTIAEVVETWESLDYEDKEMTLEILQKGFAELKRQALVDRIHEAEQNYTDGKVRSGSADDLFEELNNV
jgi:hypothetical protein